MYACQQNRILEVITHPKVKIRLNCLKIWYIEHSLDVQCQLSQYSNISLNKNKFKLISKGLVACILSELDSKQELTNCKHNIYISE